MIYSFIHIDNNRKILQHLAKNIVAPLKIVHMNDILFARWMCLCVIVCVCQPNYVVSRLRLISKRLSLKCINPKCKNTLMYSTMQNIFCTNDLQLPRENGTFAKFIWKIYIQTNIIYQYRTTDKLNERANYIITFKVYWWKI